MTFLNIINNDHSVQKNLLSQGVLKLRSYGKHGTALRVTAKGKKWILDNIETINSRLVVRKALGW